MKCKKLDLGRPPAILQIKPKLAFSLIEEREQPLSHRLVESSIQKPPTEFSSRIYKPTVESRQTKRLSSLLEPSLLRKKSSKLDQNQASKKSVLHMSLYQLYSKHLASDFRPESARESATVLPKPCKGEEAVTPSKELRQFEQDLGLYMNADEDAVVFTNSGANSPTLVSDSSRQIDKPLRIKPSGLSPPQQAALSKFSKGEPTTLQKLIEGVRMLKVITQANKSKSKPMALGKGLAAGNSRSTHGTETDLHSYLEEDVKAARRFTSRLGTLKEEASEGSKILAADLIATQSRGHGSRGRLSTARSIKNQAGASSKLVN